MPMISFGPDDQPPDEYPDGTKARELLERHQQGEIAVGYAVLHLATHVEQVGNTLAILVRLVHHATDIVATNNTSGVVLVRIMPGSQTWQATWRCGGHESSSMHAKRWDALKWAADLPAGVRLISNPETNDWEPWSAVAVRHGDEGIGEDYRQRQPASSFPCTTPASTTTTASSQTTPVVVTPGPS